MSPTIINPFRFASGVVASNLTAAVGGFNAPNSAVSGTQVSVTGLAFQPTLVILWSVGTTDTDDTARLSTTAAGRTAFGMFTASEQYGFGTCTIDNSADANSNAIHRNDAALCIVGSLGTDHRGLVFHSMNSDGFTVKISTTGTLSWAGLRIHYLALGGTDLTNIKINSVFPTSTTGNKSFTPLAGQPVALIAPNLSVALNTLTAAEATPLIGLATGASNQYLWASADIGANTATMDSSRYGRTDECGGLTTVNAMTTRVRHVSMDATGWTMNQLEVTGASWTFPYCAFGGVLAHVGTFTASAGGASVTGVGFTPKCILFLSHGTTESTADTPTANFGFSIGAIAGASQLCAHERTLDAAATSDITTAHRDDGVLITTAAGALDSRLNVSSLDSDGFTYTMPTSTLSGYLVGYLALG